MSQLLINRTLKKAVFTGFVSILLIPITSQIVFANATPFGPEIESINAQGAPAQPPGDDDNGGANAVISNDGRYIGFLSDGNNMSSSVPNNYQGYYVRDRVMGTTTLLSLGPNGELEPGNYALSGDGQHLAIGTQLSIAGYPNTSEVYERNLATGTFTLASVDSTGNPIIVNQSTSEDISDDGTYVTFESQGSTQAIYQHDLTTGQTTLVPDSSQGQLYVTSGNGQVIVFLDTNQDLMQYNVSTNTLSPAIEGVSGNTFNGIDVGGISDNGNYISFADIDTNFGGTAGYLRIYRGNLSNETVQLADINQNGSDPSELGNDEYTAISGDGSTVAFLSSDNIDPRLNTSGGGEEGYVHNFTTGTTNIFTRNANGNLAPSSRLGDEDSYVPQEHILSGDGSLAVFTSPSAGPNYMTTCAGVQTYVVSPNTAQPDNTSDGNCDREAYVDSTAPFPVDTPPVVTGAADRAPNTAGWFNAPVTITWSSVNSSSSAGTPTIPAPTTADTQGLSTYTSGQSCNLAGYCATGSITLSIDSVPPSGAFSGSTTIAPQLNQTISGTATDDDSGVANVQLTIGSTTLSTANGGITISCNVSKTSCQWKAAASKLNLYTGSIHLSINDVAGNTYTTSKTYVIL